MPLFSFLRQANYVNRKILINHYSYFNVKMDVLLGILPWSIYLLVLYINKESIFLFIYMYNTAKYYASISIPYKDIIVAIVFVCCKQEVPWWSSRKIVFQLPRNRMSKLVIGYTNYIWLYKLLRLELLSFWTSCTIYAIFNKATLSLYFLRNYIV